MSIRKLSTLAAVSLAFCATALADTHTRKHKASYHSSNGKSGTAETSVEKSPGERKRHTDWSNDAGQSGSRDATRTYDRESQTGTVSEKTTGPNGKTTTRQGAFAKGPDSSVTSGGTITGPNGNVSTYAGTAQKTENGHTSQTVVTGPNGKETTVQSTVSHADGTRTRDTVVTKPSGQTTTQNAVVTKTGEGTATKTVQTTHADGSATTRSADLTVEKAP